MYTHVCVCITLYESLKLAWCFEFFLESKEIFWKRLLLVQWNNYFIFFLFLFLLFFFVNIDRYYYIKNNFLFIFLFINPKNIICITCILYIWINNTIICKCYVIECTKIYYVYMYIYTLWCIYFFWRYEIEYDENNLIIKYVGVILLFFFFFFISVILSRQGVYIY